MENKKTYVCFLRSDPNKEPINKILAVDYDDALDFFSERKKMDKFTFLTIFDVEEDGNKLK